MLKLRKRKIKLPELGSYLRRVAIEYPDLNDPTEIANKVAEIFSVRCTKEDVIGYHNLHVEHEDLELENRKQKHGLIY